MQYVIVRKNKKYHLIDILKEEHFSKHLRLSFLRTNNRLYRTLEYDIRDYFQNIGEVLYTKEFKHYLGKVIKESDSFEEIVTELYNLIKQEVK